jgi:hypothetical protein
LPDPFWLIDRRAWGNCEKAGAFFAELFQAAVEIITRMTPKATLIDFQSCGSFHGPFPFRKFSFFLLLFLSLSISNACPENVVPGSPINDDRHSSRAKV